MRTFTTKEVAELFEVTEQSVARWVRQGKLIPTVKGTQGGGGASHEFTFKSIQDYIVSRNSTEDAEFLEPTDRLALAREEEVRLKNEQTKGTLVNRAMFETEFYNRLKIVTQNLTQIPDAIITLNDAGELKRADIDELIREALEAAYQGAVGE